MSPKERSHLARGLTGNGVTVAVAGYDLTPYVIQPNASITKTARIFPFGVSRNRLEKAIERLRVPATIVRDIDEATMGTRPAGAGISPRRSRWCLPEAD